MRNLTRDEVWRLELLHYAPALVARLGVEGIIDLCMTREYSRRVQLIESSPLLSDSEKRFAVHRTEEAFDVIYHIAGMVCLRTGALKRYATVTGSLGWALRRP